MTTNEDGNMTRFKKVLNFAAQKERQFIQLKIIKPLRRAERQHTRGALLILGSNEIHRDTLLPKFYHRF